MTYRTRSQVNPRSSTDLAKELNAVEIYISILLGNVQGKNKSKISISQFKALSNIYMQDIAK